MLEWFGLARPRPVPAPAPQPADRPAASEEPATSGEESLPPASPALQEPTAAVIQADAVDRERELLTVTLANMAIRDLTLVESLLDIVEELETKTEDPDLLEQLFRIDNLATRMRRNGENLLVLAGQDTGDPHMEPVPLLDVARAAISEISDYERVRIGKFPERALSGTAADDISHLLAELLDNATAKSPDHAQVVISAQEMADERLLITVEDEGIGIPESQLADLNDRLSGAPVMDERVIKHMGLYVVSRIAQRHDLRVQLEARSFRGVSAHVIVPDTLLRHSSTPKAAAEPPRSVVQSPPAPRPTPATVPTSASPASGPAAGSSSGLTAAGLPRRSANRTTTPMPTLAQTDDASSGETPPEDAASRAERIRADLDGFLEGERAATKDEKDE
ncbi:Histidine kinase-, DNA gyrase B-, and HSP90-like ATPase [Marinactinospora thermotolerans DSM 45154]|uniref:histidine kinase n=1 Tax=Marinactinospora thermotolerans DSM 45154 TaxID=1122192 RepID=A0A1T4RRQ9_9ACTN|nr:Histidine kinase-, DNA gyrase B-, and HSP90-like ATPase [Marinactinospora thermotolerans DSM 45154]